MEMLGLPDNDMAPLKRPAECGDAARESTRVPPEDCPKMVTLSVRACVSECE